MAVELILGGSGSVDERGIMRRSLMFRCDSEEECLTGGPESYLGLGQKKGGRTWEPTTSGRFKLTVVYEGVGENEPDPERKENFEWVPMRSEEPIESHPKISEIIKTYGGTIDPETKKLTFDRLMPRVSDLPDGLPGPPRFLANDAPDPERNPMFGRESYLLKTGIWRWTFFSREYPQEWEDKDGTVVDRVPGGRATPPNKDWWVNFQSARPVGSGESFGYDVQVDFVLSLIGGWPPPQFLLGDD